MGHQREAPERQQDGRRLQRQNEEDRAVPRLQVTQAKLRSGQETDQSHRQALHHRRDHRAHRPARYPTARDRGQARHEVAEESRHPHIMRDGAEGVGREKQDAEQEERLRAR